MEFIKVVLRIIKDKVKDNLFGLMGNIIMENGWIIKNMEVEFGPLRVLILSQILILDNGKMVKLMDMEFILGVDFVLFRKWNKQIWGWI